MTREEAKEYWLFRYANAKDYNDQNWDAQERREHRDYVEALLMAIEALSAEADKPVLCEDCRYRNTWDNPRLEPQYYKCGMGVKFRDYGYVREDDYCPFGARMRGEEE